MTVKNRACALLGCARPIVLAGMGGPSRAELVAAVTRAGGFGFLGMVREPPELISAEVEKLRAAGCERFGVNIIPAATDPGLLDAQIETIIALGVPVVCLFWDLDPAVVARLRAAGIIVIYQVGSVDEALAAERAGAQIIIAQGCEAGGHVRGTTPLHVLLPQVVDAVTVPVLAAGGLATGGDLLIAQALGAEGAVFGTAFLAASESFAHSHHKQRLVEARPGDTLLTEMFHINWPPGAPVRVLASAVTEGGPRPAEASRVIGAEGTRPIYLFSTDSPLQSMTGDFESMALYAGTGVGSIDAVRPAAEILLEIVVGAATGPVSPDTGIEQSSPACYAHEMGGAYMGQPEPDEVAAEIAALLADLKAMLAASLADGASKDGNGPPFSRDGDALARWIVRLAPVTGDAPIPRRAAIGMDAARRAAVDRLGLFVPRLFNAPPAADLAVLRRWLAMEEAPEPVLP
ncbi:NAD(P)H-dependent flavin oxidoreductase [Pelagibacterium sediminicola]|uniref:NAD(P)H-dependent flavin oxidoreductase n=1 Tax=Pelagibacterium sediminicola TaxID=2248761 RepID=UPI000E316BF1|nr:nitronate monooxygenase [Pelagibacterium sediminicola]